jgi:hypothetical protein
MLCPDLNLQISNNFYRSHIKMKPILKNPILKHSITLFIYNVKG